MADYLTRAEIEARFAGDWVLVGDPQTDEALEIKGGRVLSHSKDRDEVYRQAIALRPQRSAILNLGKMPESVAINL
jgi:hypothetical protein